jgi:hypothetical protein
MKHVKTFESFLSESQINEGISSKAKNLMSKFEDCQLVSNYYEDSKAEDVSTENEDAAMKEFGTTPDTTLVASNANDLDGYDDFLEDLKKSGLKYVEKYNESGYDEVFISGK